MNGRLCQVAAMFICVLLGHNIVSGQNSTTWTPSTYNVHAAGSGGSNVNLYVALKDANGQPPLGIVYVSYSIVSQPGGCSLSSSSSWSDENGIASVTFIAGSVTGQATVTATGGFLGSYGSTYPDATINIDPPLPVQLTEF